MTIYILMACATEMHIPFMKGVYSSLEKAFEKVYYDEVEICAHGWRNGIPELVWHHYGVFWDGRFKEDWDAIQSSNKAVRATPRYRIMAENIDHQYPPPKYAEELQGYVVTLSLPPQDSIFSIIEAS